MEDKSVQTKKNFTKVYKHCKGVQTEKNTACEDVYEEAKNIVKNFHKIESYWQKVEKYNKSIVKRSYIILAYAVGVTIAFILQLKKQ